MSNRTSPNTIAVVTLESRWRAAVVAARKAEVEAGWALSAEARLYDALEAIHAAELELVADTTPTIEAVRAKLEAALTEAQRLAGDDELDHAWKLVRSALASLTH